MQKTGENSFVRICGIGSYLPERIVTNRDLEETLDTTDEWIFSHTGIRERRICSPDESASSMGIIAARRALEDSGVSADELCLVLASSSTGDYVSYPATAALIQNGIGAVNAGACDISAACTGFCYSIALGRSYCLLHRRPVLIVSTEVNSRMVDWHDRSTSVLFGDGAGAVVLVPSGEPGIIDDFLGSDGSGARLLTREGGASTEEQSLLPVGHLKMEGKAVFQFAVKTMEKVIRELLSRNGVRLEDVNHLIPHQANGRILTAVARSMGIPQERFYQNLGSVANTSSASIPIALSQMSSEGILRKGDLVLTVAFGAGLLYGGTLFRWK